MVCDVVGYKNQTQQKNIAWFLPRPKLDRYKGGMPLYAEEWIIQLGKDILKKDDIDILNAFFVFGSFWLFWFVFAIAGESKVFFTKKFVFAFFFSLVLALFILFVFLFAPK